MEISSIPLLTQAEGIIKKYNSQPPFSPIGNLFPILSNHKMNSYLKELADISGIKKTLTFHCARHTFATSVTLTNGVSIETVSRMLGHRSLRTTQIYAKVLDKKVSLDMLVLKKKLEDKKKDNANRQ